MKKLLMTLFVAFAFCGSMFAQLPDPLPGAPWADFSDGPYASSTFVVAFVQINGTYVEATDNWADLQVGSCILNADGTILQNEDGSIQWRGFQSMFDYTDDGDPHPIVEDLFACYNATNESVTFMLYDASTGTLYDQCSIFRVSTPDVPLEIVTGDYSYNELYFDYDEAVVLNFSMGGINKNIIGYEPVDHWYLISSPVGEVPVANVANLTINDFDLYYFNQQGDEEGKEWMNYELGDDQIGFSNLELGKGYLYANIADVTLKFPGSAYTGEGNFPLEYYTGTLDDENLRGCNLMGNPYNEAVNVDKPFYRMIENEFVPKDANAETIDPMEGVIVYAEGENESVTFTPATTGGKTATLTLNIINGNKVLDRAIIGFGEGRRLPKLQFNQNSSKVYITMDNKDYAIVRSEGMGEMPVSFKAESNGTYSLSFNSNVEFSYLHLIDNLTGANQDLLANPSYTFEAKTTDYASRFRLVFATGNNEDNFAFFSNGNLIINNEGNATLQVVDVTGRVIKCESINGSASVNIDAASGVYMVRLINGDNVKVQKVVK